MTKKKYKIVLRQNGQEKQLFSIIGQENGHITYILLTPLPDEVDNSIETKISFKMSLRAISPKRSVHITQLYKTRMPRHDYAEYPLIDDVPFIYPMGAVLVGNLNDKCYNLNIKPSDKIIPILGYNTRASTILLFMFFTDKVAVLPAIFGLRKSVIRFSYYNIVIYSTSAIGIPSPYLSVQLLITTKPPKIDGLFQSGREFSARPIPLGAINDMCLSFKDSLTRSFFESAVQWHTRTGTPNPYPHPNAWLFEPNPTGYDMIDATYGPHGRLIISDNAKEMLENFTNKMKFNEISEFGDPEGMERKLREIINFGTTIKWDDVVNVSGGNVAEYIRKHL